MSSAALHNTGKAVGIGHHGDHLFSVLSIQPHLVQIYAGAIAIGLFKYS